MCGGGGGLPLIKGRVAVYVGAHRKWSTELTEAVDLFCENYNGIVICDQTSNYWGKYRALSAVVCNQKFHNSLISEMDLMIHIGEIPYDTILEPDEVWRVNLDGEINDIFKKLSIIYEMEEIKFFQTYNMLSTCKSEMGYWNAYSASINRFIAKIPELPFSNAWIAHKTAKKIPSNSVLYFNSLSSLQSWNYFEPASNIVGYADRGGQSMDSYVSILAGAAQMNPQKLYYCVIGDMTLFYGLDVLENHYVGRNIRILLVHKRKDNQNRKDIKFKEIGKPTEKNEYFINQPTILVRTYAENYGYEYISASNKDEYIAQMERFISPELTEKPLFFEVFTDIQNESEAFEILNNLELKSKELKRLGVSRK